MPETVGLLDSPYFATVGGFALTLGLVVLGTKELEVPQCPVVPGGRAGAVDLPQGEAVVDLERIGPKGSFPPEHHVRRVRERDTTMIDVKPRIWKPAPPCTSIKVWRRADLDLIVDPLGRAFDATLAIAFGKFPRGGRRIGHDELLATTFLVPSVV